MLFFSLGLQTEFPKDFNWKWNLAFKREILSHKIPVRFHNLLFRSLLLRVMMYSKEGSWFIPMLPMNRCCNYSTCPCRVSSSSPWWQAPRSRGELWSGFPIWQVGKKIHGDPKSTQFLTELLTTYSGVINGLYTQLYSPTYGLKSNKSRQSLPKEFSPDGPVFRRVVFFVCVFDFDQKTATIGCIF